jgi:hypothetical protein
MDWAAYIRDASIVLASVTVIYGIDAWRREFRGKRQIELAEETLALFYEANDAISHMRRPGGLASEGQTRKSDPEETEGEKRLLDAAFFASERYQKYQALFSKLHAMRYRFMAQFGAESAKPFDALHEQIGSILSAGHMLSMMWARDIGVPNPPQSTPEFDQHMTTCLKVYWEGWEGYDNDPIKRQMERIVRDIETTCRAIIASEGTLFSLINMKLPRLRRGS